MDFPLLFVGPAGSGKTFRAREHLANNLGVSINDVYPKDLRLFKLSDDYECRVFCSPYHFEIDIPDMSMQDKQILVEVLTMLFSAGDVFSGLKTNKRKLVILRRAHCLSLAAATRLRWILETWICPVGGTGMIWLCAREITGSLAVIEDIFVRMRVPCLTREAWIKRWAGSKIADIYDKLEGRLDRAYMLEKWGDKCIELNTYPRITANCYEELMVEIIRGCVKGALKNIEKPPLALASWIRERVYDFLGLCQTGTEFLDGYSGAIENAFQNGYCTYPMFIGVIKVLALSEPNTSYRNPISLEKILLDICIVLWNTTMAETNEVLVKIESKLPVAEVHGDSMESSEGGMGEGATTVESTKKRGAGRGPTKAKKRGESTDGSTVAKRAKPRKKKGNTENNMG